MSKIKQIKKNWDAIEELEKRVREKTGDPNAGFNASSYFFGDRKLFIPCLYRKPKKKGGFTEKYFDMLVLAEYCPFTGKPLYDKKEQE